MFLRAGPPTVDVLRHGRRGRDRVDRVAISRTHRRRERPPSFPSIVFQLRFMKKITLKMNLTGSPKAPYARRPASAHCASPAPLFSEEPNAKKSRGTQSKTSSTLITYNPRNLSASRIRRARAAAEKIEGSDGAAGVRKDKPRVKLRKSFDRLGPPGTRRRRQFAGKKRSAIP